MAIKYVKDVQHHLSLGKCKSKPQWDNTLHHLARYYQKPENASVGKDEEKSKVWGITVGMQNGEVAVENDMHARVLSCV